MKRAVSIIGIMLFGVLLGAGMASTGGDVQASEPRTITKEVPGPVQVKTETKTVTVKETPIPCLVALDAAEEAFMLAGEGFGIAAEYAPLVADAYEAGLTGNLNLADRVLATMEKTNAQSEDLIPQMETTGKQFNIAKEACRNS